jgi:hypothetical protein
MSSPRFATFTHLGVRYRYFKTHPNRWSDGKVHLQFWSREHRQYALVCKRGDVGAFSGYFGTELAEPVALTCKSCIRRAPQKAAS